MEMVGFIFFYVPFVILAGIMANKRKRSTAGWVILSLVVSPLITILFLLALGEKEEGDTPKVVEEKQESEAHEVNTHETTNHKIKAWEYLAGIDDPSERKKASMKVFQNMKQQMIDKSDAEVTRAWQTIVSKANQIRKELKQQQAEITGVKEKTGIKETPTCDDTIDHSKTPKIAAITVVGALFVGMLGVTIYSVGQMQKMKYAESTEPQIVEVEKIVEVERKNCDVDERVTAVSTLAALMFDGQGAILDAVFPHLYKTSEGRQEYIRLKQNYDKLAASFSEH